MQKIPLSYLEEENQYRIGDGKLHSKEAAVDFAYRILKHAGAGDETTPQTETTIESANEPSTRSRILYTAQSIFDHFRPQLILLDWEMQETFRGLIGYKIQNGGATPSRRNLGAFMFPHLKIQEFDSEAQKDEKRKKLENRTRNFTGHFDKFQLAGIGKYKKNRNKKGRDTFIIDGEIWGIDGRNNAGEVEAWGSELKIFKGRKE